MLEATQKFLHQKTSPQDQSFAEMQQGFTDDETAAYRIILNGLWSGISTFDAESAEDDHMAIMSATYLVDTLKKLGFKITRSQN